MVQGTRRAPGGKSLPGVKVNRKSAVSKRKVTLAKKASRTGNKSSRKSNSAAKIKKKLQFEINSRIEQELRARATQDGNTFKILSLAPNKSGKSQKKPNTAVGKKIIHVTALDAPGPSSRADVDRGTSSRNEDFNADNENSD